MTIILTSIAVLSVVAVIGSIVVTVRDGYRRTPTLAR